MTGSRPRVGDVVDGKYELMRVLGSGAQGEVFEARHHSIRRRAVLKFLWPDTESPNSAARFFNEARAAGEIKHDNIIDVYDIGMTADGARYIVMEYCDGRDAAAELALLGRLPATRAVDIAMQLCRGLAVIHNRRIVHRDLKPANLLLTARADGTQLVKILDFGVAKLSSGAAAASLTAVGHMVGSLAYMPPEQVRADPELDHRADLYAVGAILYELLTGETPFAAAPSKEAFYLWIEGLPPPPRNLFSADQPPGLGALVMRALAKHRDSRFASAQAFEAALVACMSREPALEPQAHAHVETLPVNPYAPTQAEGAGHASRSSAAVRDSDAPPSHVSFSRPSWTARTTVGSLVIVSLATCWGVTVWWSDEAAPTTDRVWPVGDTSGAKLAAATVTLPARVQSAPDALGVPGAARAEPRFRLEPELVIDRDTGLTWQRHLPPATQACEGASESRPTGTSGCTWHEAQRYCAELSLEGRGWRLPEKSELASIVDASWSRPALDPEAFPGTPPEDFWSSSMYIARDWRGAWGVQFSNGYSFRGELTVRNHVRCVRSAPTGLPGVPSEESTL